MIGLLLVVKIFLSTVRPRLPTAKIALRNAASADLNVAKETVVVDTGEPSSERLDLFTVLGAALILTGNLLNLRVDGAKAVRAET